MASRKEEKERLRRERQTREQAERESARRRQRVYGLGAAAVLIIAATLSVALVVAGGGAGGGSRSAGASSLASTNLDGLAERREVANVTTMMDTMESTAHAHPEVRIYVEGKRIEAPPPNVGIDPNAPPMDMASLHTHDASGTIHMEGMENAKLSQLFAVWGVRFSRSRLGPYRATKTKRIRMWVDARPSRAFGDLELRDKQQTVISYGTRAQEPVN